MSKHKIRYILPLLAIMTSAACVGASEPSEKAVPKVTRQKQDNKDICPQSMMKDIDGQGYECVDIFSMRLEEQLNKKYENLLHRIDSKDPKLYGNAVFRPIRYDESSSSGRTLHPYLQVRAELKPFKSVGTL